MKKHIKLLIVLGIVLLSGISFFLGKESKEKDIFKEESSNIKKKDTHLNSVSMMLETKANSGNYEMTTRDSWPTEGYIFNSELSKCENGGELSWDNEKKVVLMSGNVSDKCYVYFDKVVIKPVIKNVSFDILSGSCGIQSMDIDTVRPISRYYIKVKNGKVVKAAINLQLAD